MTRFVLLLVIFISNTACCQVDPAKKDSLASVIGTRQKSIELFQDSFIRVQESTYHAAAIKLQDSIQHYTSLLAERKQEVSRNERQIYNLLGITALLLVLLVIGWRLRKKSKQS